jgi:hypothetical protein
MLLPMNDKQLSSVEILRSTALGALLVLCGASVNCGAGQTSMLFRTTSIDGSEGISLEELKMRTSGELSGMYARETLPADQFPEANWGHLTNGIRVSVRTSDTNLNSQTNFTVGKPLHIAILLRNESEDVVRYTAAHWINYPFVLTLTRSGTRIAPRIPSVEGGPHDGSVFGRSVPPGSQHREILRLDKIYDLSQPGDYEISAAFEQRGWRAKSGAAKFRIKVESDAPSKSTPPAKEKALPDTKNSGEAQSER